MPASKPICIRCEKYEYCQYPCEKFKKLYWEYEFEAKCPYKLYPIWEEGEIRKRTKKAPTQIEQELEKVKRKSKYGL